MKTLAIFGSTGSIGCATVELVKQNLSHFSVEILTAQQNYQVLIEQAKILKPKYICLVDESNAKIVKDALKDYNIELCFGFAALVNLAKIKVDLVVMAISGFMALKPTLEVILAGSTIALANKESLVCAGSFITALARAKQVNIIPLDSEHNALFQIFDFTNPQKIKNVVITASGGPFLSLSQEELKQVTVAQAVKHPNWQMGAKISVDSATLVNKCFEVIETYHLFPLSFEQIKVIIHPQSIIHAMVNFINGSVHAQLSKPDMKIAIGYGLFYPDMVSLPEFNDLDLTKLTKLEFFQPDDKKFKSLALLNNIAEDLDSNLPIAFNIANDLAVSSFLKQQISFLQIYDVIEAVLNQTKKTVISNLDEVFAEIELLSRLTEQYLKLV